MKKLFIVLFALSLLICSEVSAQSHPKFPVQIAKYTLDVRSVNFDSRCNPYLGENLCQEYWQAYYVGPNNKRVVVHLHNVSDGMSAYHQRLLKGEKIKVSSDSVYKTGGELSWLLQDEASIDGFTFNSLRVLEMNTVSDRIGQVKFNEDLNAKGNNPVTKYFINLYPPDNEVIKTKTPKFDVKKMKITITSPAKKDKIIAGEEYEITWKSKKTPPNSEILFQLKYGEGEMSFGKPVPDTGSYMWKVPLELAQSDNKATPYQLVAYLMGFDGVDRPRDYSDPFSIITGDSDVIHPMTINMYIGNGVLKTGSSRNVYWREFNSVSSYTVSLVKEGEEVGKIVKKVKPNETPFFKELKWKINKDILPGRYYLKIEGFENKNRLVAEAKSPVFEIVK